MKGTVPTGWAILATAHAAIQALEEFRYHPDTQEWLDCFRKVVVTASEDEFEEAKSHNDYIVYSDPDYGDEELVLAFRPRREWPLFFRRLKLYE